MRRSDSIGKKIVCILIRLDWMKSENINESMIECKNELNKVKKMNENNGEIEIGIINK